MDETDRAIAQAKVDLEGFEARTGKRVTQRGDNPGWFMVVQDPTTVTKVWFEDVTEFIGIMEG